MSTGETVTGQLQDRAYQFLRHALCEGRLAPGSELTESELATRFQLTKAPLRWALSRLSHEGWLVALPRRGYQVRPITLRDAQDIFAMRKLLEPPAARMAAGHIESDVLLRMDDAVRRPYEAGEEEAQRQFFSANKAFHVGIAEASGNQRLAAAIAGLHDECERILRFGMTHLDWSSNWRHGHEEIVEALVRGDGAQAEQLALRQLETSEKFVLGALLAGFSDIPLGPRQLAGERSAGLTVRQ
ncbi:MAG: GntR family transcriptional regulator [Burkholderiaceae bacterium]|jgi:DNA-binding GntR family transcriptional regulator|nr:GntR family transcriptional regulator [Burkholderiaceae bacterium]